MSRKTFYIVICMILLMVSAFFAVKLHSLPWKQCAPVVDYACMYSMEMACANTGGDHTGWLLEHSFCAAGACIGLFKYYCDYGYGPIYSGKVYCDDENSWMCGNW